MVTLEDYLISKKKDREEGVGNGMGSQEVQEMDFKQTKLQKIKSLKEIDAYLINQIALSLRIIKMAEISTEIKQNLQETLTSQQQEAQTKNNLDLKEAKESQNLIKAKQKLKKIKQRKQQIQIMQNLVNSIKIKLSKSIFYIKKQDIFKENQQSADVSHTMETQIQNQIIQELDEIQFLYKQSKISRYLAQSTIQTTEQPIQNIISQSKIDISVEQLQDEESQLFFKSYYNVNKTISQFTQQLQEHFPLMKLYPNDWIQLFEAYISNDRQIIDFEAFNTLTRDFSLSKFLENTETFQNKLLIEIEKYKVQSEAEHKKIFANLQMNINFYIELLYQKQIELSKREKDLILRERESRKVIQAEFQEKIQYFENKIASKERMFQLKMEKLQNLIQVVQNENKMKQSSIANLKSRINKLIKQNANLVNQKKNNLKIEESQFYQQIHQYINKKKKGYDKSIQTDQVRSVSTPLSFKKRMQLNKITLIDDTDNQSAQAYQGIVVGNKFQTPIRSSCKYQNNISPQSPIESTSATNLPNLKQEIDQRYMKGQIQYIVQQYKKHGGYK